MRRRSCLGALTGLGIATLGQLACGDDELGLEGVDDHRQALLQQMGEQRLLPDLRVFLEHCQGLQQATVAFVDDPSPAGLEALRSHWWQARAPWKRLEVFAFGPYQHPERLGSAIDFWPLRSEKVESTLIEAATWQDPSTGLSPALGASQKGLPAIEWLLHVSAGGLGGVSTSEQLVTTYRNEPYRGHYLRVAVDDLVVQAEAILQAWAPSGGNYLSELVEPGRPDAVYMSFDMSLGEVVNRMGFTIENIRIEKLGKAIGLQSAAGAQYDVLESWASGRSLEDMLDNLAGVEALYFADEGFLGLTACLQRRGFDYDGRMRRLVDAGRAALQAIPQPLSAVLDSARPQIMAAIDELSQLQRMIQADIMNALALSLKFNDNDGD